MSGLARAGAEFFGLEETAKRLQDTEVLERRLWGQQPKCTWKSCVGHETEKAFVSESPCRPRSQKTSGSLRFLLLKESVSEVGPMAVAVSKVIFRRWEYREIHFV